jgi:hypothetical protein
VRRARARNQHGRSTGRRVQGATDSVRQGGGAEQDEIRHRPKARAHAGSAVRSRPAKKTIRHLRSSSEAAGTLSRRLQNGSRNRGGSRGLARTRVETSGNGKCPRVNLLAPEVAAINSLPKPANSSSTPAASTNLRA